MSMRSRGRASPTSSTYRRIAGAVLSPHWLMRRTCSVDENREEPPPLREPQPGGDRRAQHGALYLAVREERSASGVAFAHSGSSRPGRALPRLSADSPRHLSVPLAPRLELQRRRGGSEKFTKFTVVRVARVEPLAVEMPFPLVALALTSSSTLHPQSRSHCRSCCKLPTDGG